jgi:general secretion pathway protein D
MMRSLEQIIRQLDIRRQQVLVEAIIVEVYESEGINLGVQWGSEDIGFTQFNNGAVTPVSSIAGAAYDARETTTETIVYNTNDDGETIGSVLSTTEEGDYTALATILSGMSGFATGIIKDGWGAVIQAVSNDTNSNVLATPSITTLENEEASILVGSEVPIITGASTGSNNANPFQTVERTEVGIKLSVTPQINEGTAVQLLIDQEVSSVSGATGVDLGINKRSIKTTVLAEDGATIVIGGLIDEDVQESVSKVPLLGDIPYIGHLFRSTSTTKRKRNLMVFIRAVIIREGDDLVGESRRKYNHMRALQIEREEGGVELMPFTSHPVLGEWDESIALPPSFEEYLNEKQPNALKDLKSDDKDEQDDESKSDESKGDN